MSENVSEKSLIRTIIEVFKQPTFYISVTSFIVGIVLGLALGPLGTLVITPVFETFGIVMAVVTAFKVKSRMGRARRYWSSS